jgi:two-component system, chemotaxis family, CheB/CheR fusion protein
MARQGRSPHLGDQPDQRAAIEDDPPAQILLGRDGELLGANRLARELLGLTADDVGRRFRDLEVSSRPISLRLALDQAYRESRPVELRGVHAIVRGARVVFDVRVRPLGSGEHVSGATISFEDVSEFDQLRQELKTSNEDLAVALGKLRSTNDELETTNEELQIVNEELRSSNEELQTTNEELHSTNEELLTVNEELLTVNEELHERTGQLDEMSTFVNVVLGGVRAAVVVIDADLRIEAWSRGAEEMWGLREVEVRGRPLLSLDIGLPVQDLRRLSERSLRSGTSESAILDATDGRGHRIRCRVTSSRMEADGRDGGTIVLMEEADEGTV